MKEGEIVRVVLDAYIDPRNDFRVRLIGVFPNDGSNLPPIKEGRKRNVVLSFFGLPSDTGVYCLGEWPWAK